MDINEDLENLNILLQKIYNKTKCNKFLDDIIFLEQWLWTLSDNKKKDLSITLNGSYDAKKIKNNILSNS
jgi:hypothetical protein